MRDTERDVRRFLDVHEIELSGGRWVIHYTLKSRSYDELPDLVKNELLLWFLPAYRLTWEDIVHFSEDVKRNGDTFP